MFQQARRAGARIVEMVAENLKPRDILTPAAFANAVAAVLAVAGSINSVKHLQAIAVEAAVDIDIAGLFASLGETVPILAAVRPIGEFSIEDFDAAGGAAAILRRLQPLIDTSAMTATGGSLAENLADVGVRDEVVIRPLETPFSRLPGIVVLKGSLAPDGAIVKVGLRDKGRPLAFSGPARVFESSSEADQALARGAIVAGDVVVLRGQGVLGGPGMGGASRLAFALDGAGLGGEVAVITDGQLSGLVNKGLVVGEVTPESAVGGPLGLIEDGDIIAIDVEARSIDIQVPSETLEGRRAGFRRKPPTRDSGWLSIYERTVSPLARGASLIGGD
jgi:dihydroxy-acid dehydratase